MFLIFSIGFANKLVGMGRDAFCQAILFLLQLIIIRLEPKMIPLEHLQPLLLLIDIFIDAVYIAGDYSG